MRLDALNRMRLEKIMSADVVTIGAHEPASAAWETMWRQRVRHLVVEDEGTLVGILSERDLGGKHGEAVRKGRTVEELMSPQTVAATPDTTIRQAANIMRARTIGCLPIIDNDQGDEGLVGIVTATDVFDVLGRGSTRPTIKAERPTLRLPAGAYTAGGRRQRRHGDGPARGRGAHHRADSLQRAPMPPRLARAAKAQSGREQEIGRIPANIRLTRVLLDGEERSYLRRQLGAKLGKFADSIERVSVRLADVNGPRGGVDQVCRIKVVLIGLPSVVVERRHEAQHAAVDLALDATEEAVRRSVQRRRMKPLHERQRPLPAWGPEGGRPDRTT